VRLNLSEWLDIAIFLIFSTIAIFKALMQSGSHNPIFVKPWLPNNLSDILATITWKIEDIARLPIVSSTQIMLIACLPSRLDPRIIIQLLQSSSTVMPKSFNIDLGKMLTGSAPSTRMRLTICSLMTHS